MRYFVRFSYCGTGFHGSQSQPNGVTIQATMEEALGTILRRPCALTFAGRTDAGVHAEQMYAHMDSEVELPKNLVSRLNSLLPASIAIDGIERVQETAHARFDATERTYFYRVSTKKEPFRQSLCTRVPKGLDYAAMNSAAQHLIGEQDFASFCRVHTDVKTTICDVRDAQWIVEDEEHAYFKITADRFLRNMVRAVVGTLLEVGKGRMAEQEWQAVIDAHDRCKAGHSAPAEGLYLVEIKYPNTIYYE